jgi:hypothetical protein
VFKTALPLEQARPSTSHPIPFVLGRRRLCVGSGRFGEGGGTIRRRLRKNTVLWRTAHVPGVRSEGVDQRPGNSGPARIAKGCALIRAVQRDTAIDNAAVDNVERQVGAACPNRRGSIRLRGSNRAEAPDFAHPHPPTPMEVESGASFPLPDLLPGPRVRLDAQVRPHGRACVNQRLERGDDHAFDRPQDRELNPQPR